MQFAFAFKFPGFKQFGYSPTCPWVCQVRIQIFQRCKHEPAPGEPRMGNLRGLVPVKNKVATKDHVNIHDPGAEPRPVRTPHAFFNFLETLQCLPRIMITFDTPYSVEIRALVSGPDGAGFIYVRAFQDIEPLPAQFTGSTDKVGHPVTQIRADADMTDHVLSRYSGLFHALKGYFYTFQRFGQGKAEIALSILAESVAGGNYYMGFVKQARGNFL